MQQGRRLRGSTPSRRSRNRESEGIRFMSNIDLRLLACVELSFKRSNSSSFSSDGIFKLNTASPVIKQSDRVKPRDVIGSGTRLKHLRITRSISGIDRSLRNEFLDILLLNLPDFNVPRSNVKSPRISYKKFTYFLILRLKIDLLGIAAFAIRQPENFFAVQTVHWRIRHRSEGSIAGSTKIALKFPRLSVGHCTVRTVTRTGPVFSNTHFNCRKQDFTSRKTGENLTFLNLLCFAQLVDL